MSIRHTSSAGRTRSSAMDSVDLQTQPVVQEPHETYRGGRSCGMNGGSRLDRQGF